MFGGEGVDGVYICELEVLWIFCIDIARTTKMDRVARRSGSCVFICVWVLSREASMYMAFTSSSRPAKGVHLYAVLATNLLFLRGEPRDSYRATRAKNWHHIHTVHDHAGQNIIQANWQLLTSTFQHIYGPIQNHNPHVQLPY